MKSSVLSDDSVIDEVNRGYVAATFMIDKEFTSNVAAFAPLQKAFRSDPEYQIYFASSVILDPSGERIIGYSGRSFPPAFKPGGPYYVDKYLNWLRESRARFDEFAKIEKDASNADAKQARIEKLLEPVSAELKQLEKHPAFDAEPAGGK